MTTAASRASGTAATTSSASSVTTIMALADLPVARSAYQPVIMLTSQGPAPVIGQACPHTICRVLYRQRAARAESSRNRPARLPIREVFPCAPDIRQTSGGSTVWRWTR